MKRVKSDCFGIRLVSEALRSLPSVTPVSSPVSVPDLAEGDESRQRNRRRPRLAAGVTARIRVYLRGAELLPGAEVLMLLVKLLASVQRSQTELPVHTSINKE